MPSADNDLLPLVKSDDIQDLLHSNMYDTHRRVRTDPNNTNQRSVYFLGNHL
jgi:hypothetical protein